MQIAIVLGLLAVAVLLFSKEIFPVDLTTLILLMALILCHILTPEEAFSGFSSDITIILASIFIISGAIQRSGAIDIVASKLLTASRNNSNRLLFLIMSVAGSLAAFLNDTVVTSLLVSPVMSLAKRAHISPSKLLLPLAYAAILGGTCTLIGTSTNIAVNGFLKNAGLRPIQLFEMTPIGLVMITAGILYMLLIGKRLLPNYPAEASPAEYTLREYLCEIVVTRDSQMIGQTIENSDLVRMRFQILAGIRDGKKFSTADNFTIQPDDILIVRGKVEELLRVKETTGIEIKPEMELRDLELEGENIKIAEALINPRSNLIGATVRDIGFRERFGVVVLAIFRHGLSPRDKLEKVRLRMGDILLVQGEPEQIGFLRQDPAVSILEEVRPTLYRRQRGLLAAGIFLVAIVVAGFNWLPLSVCFLLAAVITILCRCIRIEEAYEFIDWRLLILIGGMTAFGVAMEKTSAAGWLAEGIVHLLRPLGARGILTGFFLLTILLTQPMSNAAAALVVLPIALNTARELGVNERTFAMAIMLGASISFITPLEPACILVYGPGKYRFSDFVKNGVGLTLILAVIVFFLVPAFWPLNDGVRPRLAEASVVNPGQRNQSPPLQQSNGFD
jgi:di/tricarboxylate transporter